MAPPFREGIFDIIYGTGISRTSELIDMGISAGIVEQSGSWFAFGKEKLGQGRENVRQLLEDTPELANASEEKLRAHLGINTEELLAAANQNQEIEANLDEAPLFEEEQALEA